jgi:NADH-quinone oxidoreductase subunit L
MANLLWLIPVLPLIGFLINGTLGRRFSPEVVAAVGLAGPLAGFGLAIANFLNLNPENPAHSVYFSWMKTGDFSIEFGLQADPLTSLMLLVITGIGSAIHLYSYGYMHEDKSVHRFFAYLNLFTTSMLILVMGDSLPLMFVGWEGVGLCSYLLIGFWFDEFANVDAGRKAFIANRVGDLAFLVGMFTLFSLAGTLDFAGLKAALTGVDLNVLVSSGPFVGWTTGAVFTFAALALFIGATGKSAQIPLYIWLPDAMAGPTPVSALIHAATMVTAGVYMIGRLNFLFGVLPDVGGIIAVVAAATALLSGIIAIAQNDIKKVLAYSTISQLGFMFCGMATTVYFAGFFHVVTHAFFKALLFLGAGAVIHAMHHEQDIRKMGGLWHDLKPVAILFAIGSLALAGVPGFSGFFSKDEILGAVHLQMSHGGGALWTATWWMLILTAALTAFYTTRLFVLTFFGKPYDSHRHVHHIHWTMLVPLVLLAILSAGGGFLGHGMEAITESVWKSSAAVAALPAEAFEHSHHTAMYFSIAAVVLGIGAGTFLYGFRRDLVAAWVEGPAAGVHALVSNKFYVDELYEAAFVRPVKAGAGLLFSSVDRFLIDSTLVEGPAKAIGELGGALRRAQSGAVNYANVATAIGALAVVGYLLSALVF